MLAFRLKASTGTVWLDTSGYEFTYPLDDPRINCPAMSVPPSLISYPLTDSPTVLANVERLIISKYCKDVRNALEAVVVAVRWVAAGMHGRILDRWVPSIVGAARH